MNINLTKLISGLWMGAILYILYIMLADVQYMTKLMHSYMTMVMEFVNH